MFTFSRSRLATLMAGLTLAAAANVAVADKKIQGVVENVDYETNSVTVTADKTGEISTYSFRGTPKIDVNGDKLSDMNALEPGQHVTLKLADTKKPKTEDGFDAVVLSVDYEQSTVLVRPAKGGAPRTIKLPENIPVVGLHPGASLKDLKENHIVTLKYATR